MRVVRSRWVLCVVGVAVLVALVVAQLAHVHGETGRWALSVAPPQPPFSVQYEGRTYEQGDHVQLSIDAVRQGHTKDGSPVHKSAGDENRREVVVIYVSRGEDSWAYGLVGGP